MHLCDIHAGALGRHWGLAQKVTVQVRVCLLENILGLKLTLRWCGSHHVHVELPGCQITFAEGKPYVSVTLAAFRCQLSFCLFSSWLGEF